MEQIRSKNVVGGAFADSFRRVVAFARLQVTAPVGANVVSTSTDLTLHALDVIATSPLFVGSLIHAIASATSRNAMLLQKGATDIFKVVNGCRSWRRRFISCSILLNHEFKNPSIECRVRLMALPVSLRRPRD
jgi:hypothetical protein